MSQHLAPTRLGLAVAVLVAPWSCAFPPPLETVAGDDARLADTPALRHLAEALGPGGARTAGDLLDPVRLVFARAPDPTPWLEETWALNAGRAREGTRLSVLTYNVALMDVEVLGVPFTRSPLLERRQATMPDALMSLHVDLLLLQEVWLDEDVERFRQRAPHHGYRLFVRDRHDHNDGLLVLVREALLDPHTPAVVDGEAFHAQDPVEFFPGPGIRRGWLRVALDLRGLGPLHVITTHMQPGPHQWSARTHQARELGQVVAESGRDVVIVGGDLNAGPYYAADTWRLSGGRRVRDWWRNAVSYALLQHHGGMADLFAMGQRARDRELGDSVVNDPERATEIPGGSSGWCARTPHVVFTATDCNSLSFRQYAGSGFPARIDHLMARDPRGRLTVLGSGLWLTGLRDLGSDGLAELSDHYAVHVSLLVRPP
jgi:hypothetical protein